MTPAPPSALVARFRRDLEALTGAAPDASARLGIAVSGGADSLALLLLAHAAYPGAIEAATVDHGLRPEAAGEAADVRALCDAMGVPHATLRGGGGEIAGNLQQGARALRYAALGDWAERGGLGWIATAHQRDDVAETLLMRARRGAGLGGLAEMPRARALTGTRAQLVRPLLGWARSELAELVAAARVAAVDDPSNVHPRFDRSRMRRLLADSEEFESGRLALAARNLRDAEDALSWAADREWSARTEADGVGLRLDPAGLPHELQRRLLHRAVDELRRAADVRGPWRQDGVDRLLATLGAGGIGTIAGVRASAESGKWRFAMAPPRRAHRLA